MPRAKGQENASGKCLQPALSPVASKRPCVATKDKEQEILLNTEKHAQEVLAQAKLIADKVYRPMIDLLTTQVFNLAKAIEDHHKASKAQIKDIVEAFTKQNDTLKSAPSLQAHGCQPPSPIGGLFMQGHPTEQMAPPCQNWQ